MKRRRYTHAWTNGQEELEASLPVGCRPRVPDHLLRDRATPSATPTAMPMPVPTATWPVATPNPVPIARPSAMPTPRSCCCVLLLFGILFSHHGAWPCNRTVSGLNESGRFRCCAQHSACRDLPTGMRPQQAWQVVRCRTGKVVVVQPHADGYACTAVREAHPREDGHERSD